MLNRFVEGLKNEIRVIVIKAHQIHLCRLLRSHCELIAQFGVPVSLVEAREVEIKISMSQSLWRSETLKDTVSVGAAQSFSARN